MAFIRIDYTKLSAVADKVHEYMLFVNQNMIKSSSEVFFLSASWQGSDFDSFQQQWGSLDDNDSVHTQMKDALCVYEDYLRYAQTKYRNAQTDAINRASALPIY